MNYYLEGLKDWKNFKGEATRREYWMYTLFAVIAYVIIMIIGLMGGTLAVILQALFVIVHILPSIGITARRLHNIDKSGWWMLITLVPFIGSIWLLILLAKEGKSINQ